MKNQLSAFCISKNAKIEKKYKKMVQNQKKFIKNYACEKKNNVFWSNRHAKCLFDNWHLGNYNNINVTLREYTIKGER